MFDRLWFCVLAAPLSALLTSAGTAMESPAQVARRARAIKSALERKRQWICELDITRWRFNVALCLTILLDMDAASAAAWTLRRRKWLCVALEPQHPREALLQRMLEDAVLAASASYCSSWIDPDIAALGRSARLLHLGKNSERFGSSRCVRWRRVILRFRGMDVFGPRGQV